MKSFISYIDENNKKISGEFELISEESNFIKIRTKSNEIIIPYHRLLKLKRKLKGGNKS